MSNNPSSAKTLYYRMTEGMRVTVRPSFIAEQSHPDLGSFVFAYRVRLENVGARPAQLLTRHWLIHDEAGEDVEVEGAGVVGVQPLLIPGAIYEYQSSCVLKSGRGSMEGSYRFVRPDGTSFDALIPKFDLEA